MDPIDSSSSGISPIDPSADANAVSAAPANAPSQSESTGVPPQAYPDANKIADANTPNSRQIGNDHNGPPETIAAESAKTSKYLQVEHSGPQPSPGGNFEVRTSTATYGDTPLQNPRDTKEGRAADAQARKDVFRNTGMDAGHGQGLAQGADPSDPNNITPQNHIQNRWGTWKQAENRLDSMRNDPSRPDSSKIVQTDVSVWNRPGESTPVGRQMIHTQADGTKIDQNVFYLNNQTPSSRAAQDGPLAPGEGAKLNKPFEQFLKTQASTSPEDIAKGQEAWRQMKAARGIGGTTPANDNNPPPDGPTPSGGAGGALTGTVKSTSFNLGGADLNAGTSYGSTQFTVGDKAANGTLDAKGLGYGVGGHAGVNVQNGALNADVHGGGQVYLGEASASGNLNLYDNAHLGANGNAIAGADVNAGGQLNFDPRNLTANGKLDAGAFAGGKVQGTVAGDVAGVGAGAQGSLGVGIGGSVSGDLGIDHGKVKISVGVQGYLGIGGGIKLSASVDVPKVAGEVYSVGQAAANAVVNMWNSL